MPLLVPFMLTLKPAAPVAEVEKKALSTVNEV